MVYYVHYECPYDFLPEYCFLDGDPGSVELIEQTSMVILARRRQFILGRPVRSEAVPTRMEWGEPVDRLTDYFTPEGFPCISTRMKEIVEKLDGGRHQFFQLEVLNNKGERLAEHYLWVVGELLDTVDREHTTLILRNGRWSADSVENPKLIFSNQRIGDHHFWRDEFLKTGNFLCSDEAGAAIEQAGLNGFLMRHKGTV